MSAEAAPRQPLKLTTPRRPAGAVQMAPPGQTSKLGPVRTMRPAPPDRMQEEKLAGARRSALPTKRRRRSSSSSPRGPRSRVSQRRQR